MSFGERLKNARNKKGYTQEELATLIGVAKTTLTGYEKGNREPDVIKIKKMASALGVSADYLLEINEKSEEIIDPPITREAKKLAIAYDRADVESQENAMFALRKYLDNENDNFSEASGA